MRSFRRVAARMSAPAGALAALVCLAVGARAQGAIVNPGFEEGTPGGLPAGWSSGFPSYDVELVDLGAHGGARAVRIVGRQTVPREFGNVMQSIDASALRGKRIRLSGWVRAEPLAGGAGAALWLRVDRRGGASGFLDNMGDRPIASPEWRRYAIVGEVAPDAERIYFGMMLRGLGRAWLDDVALDVLPPAPPPEPARALSGRGTANLVAFTRLLGYVRFFHPSDAAAAADWNAFAVAGVRPVEAAGNASRLAMVLDSLFRPLAPTVVVSAGSATTRTLAAPPAGATQVVMWRHLGAGLAGRGGGVYRSDRVRAPAAGALPDSFPDPLSPFVAELGGGVRALVPLAVFADSAGTLPHPVAAPAGEGFSSGPFDPDDRAVRLADVALAWTVFQHFYPYFDVAGTDWNAELPRALRAAATDADAPAFTVTLKRLVAALKDGHGRVARPRDPDRSWMPPLLLRSAEGQVVVLRVAGDERRVRPGDVLLSLDRVPVAKALARDEELISAATPQWRRWRAVSELLLGPEKSEVALELKHPDGRRETVTLRRTDRPGALSEARPAPIAELRPGLWYVDLGRATTADFAGALAKLTGARGIVFDMRGYPSQISTPAVLAHLSRTAMTSAQWHIPVVTYPDRLGMRFQRGGEWDMQPLAPYLAAPRVFLVDGRAISYAESTMGIVEFYHLGEIVGEPTAGTNGNINPFSLPGGYSLTWTGMKVLKQDGARHHGVGIAPTVPVGPTVAGMAAGKDEQLEKAIQLLDH